MGVLQRFERRLEGLVSGAFARTFGGFVEPVEVAAALSREAEDKKALIARGRVIVPNAFVVDLGPEDIARLGEYDAVLRRELGSLLSEAAQERGWSFVGPVDVRFELDEQRRTGTFAVRSSVIEATGTQSRPATAGRWRAYLVLTAAAPGGEDREVPLSEGGAVVIGRGSDVEVRLADTGVSRRHAEVRLGPDGAEVVDLGSTNGTRVNGSPVTASPLLDGDRIGLGSTDVVFRTGH